MFYNLHSSYSAVKWPMFDATHPVKKTWPETRSVARPNKNC